MTLYDLTIPSFLQSLRVLVRLLDKAQVHFAIEGRDIAELAALRLAPDMKPFPFHIEAAINNAVGAAARLRGLPAADIEGPITLSELRNALAAAIAELESLEAHEFDGVETREIVLPSPKGARRFAGLDYVLRLALPNVHFHCAIAYALLRREGVEIGKRDFLGDLPAREPPAIGLTL
ncbi:MAG: DUF1993 domain-containing protein [Pseudomonadota bacterium]